MHDPNDATAYLNLTDINTGILEKRYKRPEFRGTWYDGEDLRNAACYERNGLPQFHAKDSYMIGAMKMHKFENCYKCMKITNKKNKKSIVVKIVDHCAGCIVGKDIDLTKTAFRKLESNLDVGELDLSWKVTDCPSDIYPQMGPHKDSGKSKKPNKSHKSKKSNKAHKSKK
ncbi:hypothetical protein BD408DRAFT_430648 [Parasitella parasitica]|nr:hypothetical protein BD408DRAFT_430648 [Parasitella parasitica]